MRILNFQRVDAGAIVARFSVEISSDLTLLHWQLRLTPTGEYRSYPPKVFGPPESRVRAVSVADQLAIKITAAATAVFNGGLVPHDDRTNAA